VSVLRALGAALRARVRLIAILAIAGGLAGFLWGLADEPEYAATATVIVNDRGDAVGQLGQGVVGGQTEAAAERLIELARSDDVATLAASSLGGDVSGADVLSRTEFKTGDRGGTLDVRSVASFPDFAAAAANAYAASLVEFAERSEVRRIEDARERNTEELALVDPASEEGIAITEQLAALDTLEDAGPPLTVGREAELPAEPVSERSASKLGLAGLGIGALAGILLTLVGEGRRRPVRTDDQVAVLTGAEPIGRLGPRDAARPTRRPGVYELEPLPADRTHRLAQAVGLGTESQPGTLTVASAMPVEGRTTVALGIVAAAAMEGVSALLVEADMRRPAVAELLGIERGPGLSDYLAGAAVPREVINAIPVARGDASGGLPSFVVVTAGTRTEDPGGMLSSGRFTGLVEQLSRVYDLVVFDAPALLPAPEAVLLSQASDATLLCVRAGHSRRPELASAVKALAGLDVLGVALTGAGHDPRSLRRLPARRGSRFAEPPKRR
jgi:succinoglycan biosynthesis transport protein ExoP